MDATVLGQLKAQLLGGTIEHEESGQVLEIDQTKRIIGRAEGCDLRVDDRKVSSTHCELKATNVGVLLRDLGSTNGTWIGSTRIGEVHLTKPERIRLGQTTLDFAPGPKVEQSLPPRFGHLESRSPRMRAVFERLAAVARSSMNVHLTGESGTGKGYVARAVHEQSRRAKKPFVIVDLGQIAPTLIESALFGHVRGAFTGATTEKVSPLVEANGGTLFLDEIGDVPLELQKKLLRVLDEKVVQPVGSTRTQKVDVRIVSATLHNLEEKVNRKEFRNDLFFRLGARIELPALHDRLEDLEIITKQILVDWRRSELFDRLSTSTFEWLRGRTWEGNLRGLRDVLELAVDAFDASGDLDVERAYREVRGHLPGPVERRTNPPPGEARVSDGSLLAALMVHGATIEAVEKEARRLLFAKLHEDCDGVVSEIARRAGVSRPHARKELARLDLREVEAPPRWLRRRRTT